MASKYFDDIKGFPTKGIVMEENIWPFGQFKEKAKINIPVLLPLQEPAETTKYVKKKSNAGIADREIEETHNYVELYLPDSIYTFPTEAEMENEECTIRGASKDNPKRTEENGETIEGLTRIVKKNTELMLFIIDGIPKITNIKILGRFDDIEEAELKESNYGKDPLTDEAIKRIEKSGKKKEKKSTKINKITRKSALR